MSTSAVPAVPDAPDPGNAAPPDPTNADTSATDRDVEIANLNAEAAKWRKQLREREAELEKIRLANASDAEKAVAAARAEGAAEYQVKWRKALVQNQALAILAERGVTATEPALRTLDLDDIDIDDTGRFDRNVVTAKVDELLTRYPMFGPTQQVGPPPLPTLTGDGQRHLSTDSQVRQTGKLSDAEAERMLRYGMGG
jgi:hypothetical protein